MQKNINEVIDADLYPSFTSSGKKSARIVSVLRDNKLIDADSLQMSEEILLGGMQA